MISNNLKNKVYLQKEILKLKNHLIDTCNSFDKSLIDGNAHRFTGSYLQKQPEGQDMANNTITANSIRNNYSYLTTANTPRTNNKIMSLSHSKLGIINSKKKKISLDKCVKITEIFTKAIEEDPKSIEDIEDSSCHNKKLDIPIDTNYDSNSFTVNKQYCKNLIYNANNLKMERTSASFTNKVIYDLILVQI